MAIKIQNKIVGYEVVKEEEEAALREKAETEKEERKSATIIRMTEAIERPEGMESLEGSTYKIKTPLDDHAMYVTINDIVLNQGTEHEESTIRTHVCSVMCANAPTNHMTTYDDLERVSHGRYRLR